MPSRAAVPEATGPRAAADGQLRHRGQAAVQRMVEYAPASGSLALWCHHANVEAGEAPVFTDGHTVFYTPAFEKLPLPVQTGWVAHQVLHIALRHAQRMQAWRARRGEVDERLFNLCADAVVHGALAHLRWLRLPDGAVRLDDLVDKVLGLAQPLDEALRLWDVERLYEAVDDRRPPEGRRDGRSGGGRGNEAGTLDRTRADGPRAARLRQLGAATARDLHPRPGDSESTHPEDEADTLHTWADRLLRAQAGDGEQALLRVPLADLPRSRTPWELVLRSQLRRALAHRPAPSWSRPSRSWLANRGRAGAHGRLPWEPGTTASQNVPRLALVVDLSGSIDDGLLGRFAREVAAITRRLEAPVRLVAGDLAVRHAAWLPPGAVDLATLPMPGGGGTDFTPLLREADEARPDLVVVLTDLDGPARFRPRAPVLWAVPAEHARAVAPFGRVLVLR
jgi:predicted metal-dependent peptidase